MLFVASSKSEDQIHNEAHSGLGFTWPVVRQYDERIESFTAYDLPTCRPKAMTQWCQYGFYNGVESLLHTFLFFYEGRIVKPRFI